MVLFVSAGSGVLGVGLLGVGLLRSQPSVLAVVLIVLGVALLVTAVQLWPRR